MDTPTMTETNDAPDFTATPPALLALDWGTSSLRAFLMTADGIVLVRRASSHGIQNLPQSGVPGFEQAFTDLCADWLGRFPALAVVAGGMVGSAQGWKEAPYVACPADTATLASQAAVVVTSTGVRILIAPGLVFDPADAAPDVIRGEEIQIAGALAAYPEWRHRVCAVMPGTHSKWVEIVDGRIIGFSTYMTGELFALLRQHSILGRLMLDSPHPSAEAALAAFEAGFRATLDGAAPGLTHRLFSVRTLGLLHRLPADVLDEYLSGLLIGDEIGAALAAQPALAGMPILLIGERRLCGRYAHALTLSGVPVAAELDNTAPAGLHQFAKAAGLLPMSKAAPHV